MESADLLLPQVSQENICLPLSVNVVSKYWNVDLPIQQAAKLAEKYHSHNGNVLIEGIELAQQHGLASKIISCSLDDLKKAIDMGIPPIVILPGLYDTIQHASVISGYDVEENTIMHYIPPNEQKDQSHVGAIPDEKFANLWNQDGNIMIILAPNDIINDVKIGNKNNQESNRLCFISERFNILGDKPNAINSLNDAIKQDPNNELAYLLLGSIFNEQNSSDCIKHYEKCSSLNTNNYMAYRGLGNFYLKTKQYDKAELLYTNAIDINPNRYGPIYKNRGIVRLEQGKKTDAKKDLQDYIKFTPNASDKQSITQAINEL